MVKKPKVAFYSIVKKYSGKEKPSQQISQNQSPYISVNYAFNNFDNYYRFHLVEQRHWMSLLDRYLAMFKQMFTGCRRWGTRDYVISFEAFLYLKVNVGNHYKHGYPNNCRHFGFHVVWENWAKYRRTFYSKKCLFCRLVFPFFIFWVVILDDDNSSNNNKNASIRTETVKGCCW